METFREEHYEVEENHLGQWMALDDSFPSFEDASGIASMMGNLTRIVHCTTIREVAE